VSDSPRANTDAILPSFAAPAFDALMIELRF
jgi:hypothetical protein